MTTKVATKKKTSHLPPYMLRELCNAHDVRREALGFIRQAVGAAAMVLADRDHDGAAGQRLTLSLTQVLIELEDGGGIGSSMDLIALPPPARVAR